jgi:DNA-binding XRE family transcriptional regulator
MSWHGGEMSLTTMKQKAFLNSDVKAEYDKLESEFCLASQLISMRTKAGLTQEQVAVKMGTQKSNISRLERGDSNPRWQTLLNYAQACGSELILTGFSKAK